MASQFLDINRIKLLKKKFENRRHRLLKQKENQFSSQELGDLQQRKQAKIGGHELYEKSEAHFKKLTNMNDDEITLNKMKAINTKSEEFPTAISSILLKAEIENLKKIISEHSKNISSAGGIAYEESILNPNIPLDPTETKESQENIDIAVAQAVLSSNILEEALKRIEFLSQFAENNKNAIMKQELSTMQSSISVLEKNIQNADSIIHHSRQISRKRDKITEDSVKSKQHEIQQLLDKIENYQENLENIFNKAIEKLETDKNRKNLVKAFFESSQGHLARIHTLIESEIFGKDKNSLKNLETLLNRTNEDIIRTGKELAASSPDRSIGTMIENWITKFVRLVEDITSTFSLPNISKEDNQQVEQERKAIQAAMKTRENNSSQQTFTEAFKGKARALKNASSRLTLGQNKLEKSKNPKQK